VHALNHVATETVTSHERRPHGVQSVKFISERVLFINYFARALVFSPTRSRLQILIARVPVLTSHWCTGVYINLSVAIVDGC
jgi:hypothetical protein